MFGLKAHLEYAAASAMSTGTLEGVAYQISKESSKKCSFCINLNIKYSKICFLKKTFLPLKIMNLECARIFCITKNISLLKKDFSRG